MAFIRWSNLRARLTKPLIGLGAVGVSTVLAACYGPPPHYADGKSPDQSIEEYCETILQNGCKDENGKMPRACSDYCYDRRRMKCSDDSIVIADCCPAMSEEAITKLCENTKAGR